jgi:putative transposase
LRYDPDKHHRRSIRLKEYDYSRAGAYFITICVQQRECLFGEVVDHAMQPNDAGRMVERWWRELTKKFPSAVLDTSVLMPNHLHGVLFLKPVTQALAGGKACSPTLGAVMDWLQTMTTNEYIRGVRHLAWRSFPGRLWQRDYHDHVIRSEEELKSIREYILQNPARWAWDTENPAAVPKPPTAAF